MTDGMSDRDDPWMLLPETACCNPHCLGQWGTNCYHCHRNDHVCGRPNPPVGLLTDGFGLPGHVAARVAEEREKLSRLTPMTLDHYDVKDSEFFRAQLAPVAPPMIERVEAGVNAAEKIDMPRLAGIVVGAFVESVLRDPKPWIDALDRALKKKP